MSPDDGSALKRPRVLLADDHTMIMEGLSSVLEPEFDIVGRAEDGRQLMALAEQLKPDVIIADISMPLLNGIEAARQLKKTDPRVKFIFLTMHPEADLATEAFRAGASGYVLKHSAARELKEAIHEALKGRTYVTPRIAKEVLEGLMRQPVESSPDRLEVLTPRQREVLQLLAEGHTSKEIANILNVSTKTVEFHKGRIKTELGLRSIAELTQFAVKRGLVST
jgi:DNA-binding NarL/FixJ family response regulator